MKAAVLYGPNDLRVVQDYNEPFLTDDSIKIRVAYCGICGSDIHKYLGHSSIRPVKYPVPLGHEISGIITEIGKNVTGYKVGDKVTADPNWSCGKCECCKKGLPNHCLNSKGLVKGMVEYICVPYTNVYKIPSDMYFEDAALCEPVSCCIHGVDKLELKQNDNVIIYGFGAIGQIMIYLIKQLQPKNIIVIDTDDSKKELAIKSGANLFINPLDNDIKHILESNNISVNKIIECVGNENCIKSAIDIATIGATIIIFGVPKTNSILDFNLYDFFSKEITLKTAYLNPNTTKRAIDLIDKGVINARHIVKKIIALEELPLELSNQDNIKKGKVLVKIV